MALPDQTTDRPMNGAALRSARLAARLSMIAERIAPLALPLATVVLVFAAAAWFGLFRALPDMMRIGLGMLFAVAAIASLWPLRQLRLPTPLEIDRRLERDNKLLHTPITIEKDRLSGTPDAKSEALWQAHKERMAAKARDVAGIDARTTVPERDPWALRTVAPIVAVIAFAFSFSPQGGSLVDVFRSHAVAQATPMRIDAWITPPTYTGIAPIFLTSEINSERQTFTVPEGSIAKIRLAGGTGEETALFDRAPMTLTEETQVASSAGARAFEIDMRQAGQLEIARGEQSLNAWMIAITEDDAPVISFADEETRLLRAANGTWTLNYFATDDYRLRAARAIIELEADQARDVRPLYNAPDLPLVLPRRSSEDGVAKTVKDLTEHPWAGAPIRLTLEAEDDLAQLGITETIQTVLPGRPFSNRLARAIVEQRRNLALDANAAGDVVDVLDILTLWPEETINNASHFLGLTTARTRILEARNDDDLRGVVDYLWEIARQIEDGNLSEAERRMRQAQQALQDALENGASDEEIAQLMDELREAMQDYMRELAEQMQRNPNMAQQMPPPDAQEINPQTLDDMLDQIEEMARSGAREQAMDMLSQLNDMMNNLQMGQQQQGQQGQQGQSQAQQQMNELGEILRQQQELMNETFRQNRDGRQGQQGQQNQQSQQGQQGQQGEGQQGQGQQGQAQNGQGQQPGQGQGPGQGDGLQGLAPGQQALQDRLDQFMQGLRDMGVDPGDAFGRAGDSMEGAGEALTDGEGESALAQQGDAMDALREGAGDMMQQMQQQAQNGQGAAQPGGNRNGTDRDPLGRPQRSAGPDFGETVDVPDEIDVRRAREILEAIRRRLGDALSPQLEREYLERLLDLN